MIEAPFHADPRVAERLSELTTTVGPAIEAEVAAIVDSATGDPLEASTVGAVAAAELVARHGLDSAADLAMLALPVAASMARPAISGYRVAAIGIEAGSGDLVLGANLEFPGTDLGTTIHAEGFVALRARRRRRTLATLAVNEAHPCAHCRQTLAESSGADGLTLIDPLGHALGLWELYPWPFRPSALGVDGDPPARDPWPELVFVDPPPADNVGEALLEAGSRAHAPYSGAPSAVALCLRDGRLVSAGCVESVAFNPSITAIQAALVEVAAARVEPVEIAQGWLARTVDGPVDPEPAFRALLRAVAPNAIAHVARWRRAA